MEAVDAVMRVAHELPEGNLDFASGMVVASGVCMKSAQRVQKGSLVFAFPMVVAADASFLHAPKVHKGAPCFARRMVEGKGAHLKVAPRVQKGAHPFARDMVEEKGVRFKVMVVFVQRVFMVEHSSVWHMEVVRDVRCQSAQRVQEGVLTTVFVMVGARDAKWKDAARVHRAAQISARHMEVGRGAFGDTLVRNSVAKMMVHVTHLQGGKQGSVLLTMPWCRTSGFMVLPPLDLLLTSQILVGLER